MRTLLALMCFVALQAQDTRLLSPLEIAALLPTRLENLEPSVYDQPALPPLPKGKWIKVIATGYSPHDELDSAYRETKGDYRWMTATLTDVRDQPYGVAVPFWRIKRGAGVYVPPGAGYVAKDGRIFEADDTGGDIRGNTRDTGITHIDLRFRTTASAKKYGRREIRIFVYRDDYDTVISQTANRLIDLPSLK